MRYITLRTCLAVLCGLVLIATGLGASPAGEEEPAAAMEKAMVLDPTTGKMVNAPEYGGTLTVANLLEPENADMHFSHVPALVSGATVEKLGMMDWAIDRDMFSFSSQYQPLSCCPPDKSSWFGTTPPGSIG